MRYYASITLVKEFITPSSTSDAKKLLSAFLRMRKKNTLCVIHLTAASPKSQIG